MSEAKTEFKRKAFGGQCFEDKKERKWSHVQLWLAMKKIVNGPVKLSVGC